MLNKSLIGMIHLSALPGTPKAGAISARSDPRRMVEEVALAAAAEARTLVEAGFDGALIENMHDVPYVQAPHDPVVTAAMTAAGLAVKAAAPELTLGVQVLSIGWREAMAVALAIQADFVRVENFVFAHVADEGLLTEAVSGPLLRYRRAIGADHVRVFADIKKKHASHAITGDQSIELAAQGAELFLADGLVISGSHTGSPTSMSDLKAVAGVTDLPLLIGSGVTPEQVGPLFEHADALIVGTWIKRGGVWSNAVDAGRAAKLVAARRDAGHGR
jgi:membrane complex biogenesis BtpA family protein